jgi:hypothetical protein
MAEGIERLLRLVFARLFSKWIEGHVSPKTQHELWSLAWPMLLEILIFGLVVSAVREMRNQKASTTTDAEDSSVSLEHAGLSISKSHKLATDIRDKFKRLLDWLRPRIRPVYTEHYKNLRVIIAISIFALLLAALGSWPYDVYTLIKLSVFVVCTVAIYATFSELKQRLFVVLLFGIDVLYNPLFPIRLHRSTWVLLNLATLVVLMAFWAMLRPK